jgi:hypothetical protein
MSIVLRAAAVAIGLFGLYVYYRSIVRVMLINRRERDIVERVARFMAVTISHRLVRNGRSYEHVQRAQAWTLPLFLFIAVTSWFLIVQLSFSLILLGTGAETEWLRAFSSSGSALSTLGFRTPPHLLGEYLAIYEAAIGLAVVVLLFTFVPSYQSAIQVRERKVGWIFARTGKHPTCVTLVESLQKSGRIDDVGFWEDWESWFRGLLETHSIAPILAHVPSVYRGTNWIGAAAAVLDTASLHLSTLESRHSDTVRICRETGVAALNLIAAELDETRAVGTKSNDRFRAKRIALFDQLYEKLVEMKLPLRSDKEQCRSAFLMLCSEYQSSIHHIASATLMPIDEP